MFGSGRDAASLVPHSVAASKAGSSHAHKGIVKSKLQLNIGIHFWRADLPLEEVFQRREPVRRLLPNF